MTNENEKGKVVHVAILTFHMAHNFGAMLQAYALQHAILSLGFACDILDYRFQYIDQWHGIHRLKELCRIHGPILGALKYTKRRLNRDYQKLPLSRIRFDQFMRSDLRLSPQTYYDSSELKKANYDVIIFGSDQIWNPELTNGLATEYFGGFCNDKRTKLVAYAASNGKDSIASELKVQILPLLKRFYMLGIREKSLAEYLQKEYGLNTNTVMDPVFLLEKQVWKELIKDTSIQPQEPYLLIYAFQVGEEIYRLARKIASMRQLKLVMVGYNKKEDLDDILQLTDCGPREFLTLVYHAQFVCTTSFHGMAFSILFEKSFYCIGHPLYRQRNWDLLEMIGMTDRIVANAEEVDKLLDCDYSKARKVLYNRRKECLLFLQRAIQEDNI